MGSESAIHYLLARRNRRLARWRWAAFGVQVLLAGTLLSQHQVEFSGTVLVVVVTCLNCYSIAWMHLEASRVAGVLSELRRRGAFAELATTLVGTREILRPLRNEALRRAASAIAVPVVTMSLDAFLRFGLEPSGGLSLWILVLATTVTSVVSVVSYQLAACAWRQKPQFNVLVDTGMILLAVAAPMALWWAGALSFQWGLLPFYALLFPAICWRLAILGIERSDAVQAWFSARSSATESPFLPINPLLARSLVQLRSSSWMRRIPSLGYLLVFLVLGTEISKISGLEAMYQCVPALMALLGILAALMVLCRWRASRELTRIPCR
ncbi:MAG: hypothetical protein HY319_05760 [Armatimonadetes bacterium]|nr:hypothetical protein [Armatimonadota bacterium]